ncbi:hypothetical protein REPUB_Repub01dG0271100 [Reevesia pubescens]
MPQTPIIRQDKTKARKRLSLGAIVAIVVANCVVFLVVVSFVVAYYCGINKGDYVLKADSEKKRMSGSSYGSEKKIYAYERADSDETNATDMSKLVFFKRRKFIVCFLQLL